MDAAAAHLACVPARAALFKLYLAAAVAPEQEPTASLARICNRVVGQNDRECARAAVHGMRDALVSMDPIHAGWYRQALARVAAA